MSDDTVGGVYDRRAGSYASVRPDYPDEVFDTIASYASASTGARVLEIGCGAGQATLAMTARGWRVDAVEPGEQLIEQAQHRCSSQPVRFHRGRFEDVSPEPTAFDVVAAGTSWHWIDPAVSYARAFEMLRPHGTIALFWNAHVPDTDLPQWEPIRATYRDVAPALTRLAPLTPDRHDYVPHDELQTCGVFDHIEAHRFGFEVRYTTQDFLELIATYASHEALEPATRQRLHEQLRDTIDNQLDGVATKPYEALLVLGSRRASR
ncbi:MAG: class I SAM-dependent methyltransferase [Actinomycetota bacterium]